MNVGFSRVIGSNLFRMPVLALGLFVNCKCYSPNVVPASQTSVPSTSASTLIAPTALPSITQSAASVPVLGTGAPIAVSGIDMIGNPKFNLTDGKIYGFNGAEVSMNDNRFRVKYNSTNYSGAVHTWGENPAWNGDPIDLKSYSKLFIVIEGSAAETKVELNDTVVIDYGSLLTGVNVIDLDARKKDDFAPLTVLKKINFVNKPGTGQYMVRVTIQ